MHEMKKKFISIKNGKMVSFTQDSEFIFLFDNAVVIATQTKIVLRS